MKNTYLLRKDGQTMARVIAETAKDALAYFGIIMDDLCSAIEDVISHYGLDFVFYGLTYGFSSQHGIVAIKEVSR